MDGIDQFDASFFNISGKEAEAMDPQQRLILEVVYEALEDAGITLDEISGTRTAVFAGSFTNDYALMTARDMDYYPLYAVNGTSNAVLANRVSFFFNLHGPSVTVDTACSASLVGFHLGNESLIHNESDYAIVVGSALHFIPNTWQVMTDMGLLSTDGRCRAFDAAGVGYGRGEGVIAFVLQRAKDAKLPRAIVCATHTNHDGAKTAIGLPSTAAQERLIRETYAKAKLNPDDTSFFEAHGTGTRSGDPREARAIGAAFASDTRCDKLRLGSVKTNIGHLEGAAGLAGVLKAVLALEDKIIPPNMLFKQGKESIDFDAWKLKVPTKAEGWDGWRRASVNSFGYSGSNVHVILEQLPNEMSIEEPLHDQPYLFALSAKSEISARRSIEGVTHWMRENAQVSNGAVASALARRSQHPIRAFEVSGMPTLGTDSVQTTTVVHNPRIGFIFTGQGAQAYDMARSLLRYATFRSCLDKADVILQTLSNPPTWSILEELERSGETSNLSQSEFSQPICTVVQLGLVQVLKSWGVEPTTVCGHSSGEIAAAYAASMITFAEAIEIAYYRGYFMSKTSRHGGMLAVGLSEEEAASKLPAFEDLSVGAVNSPSNVTISGSMDSIIALESYLSSKGIFARRLRVQQAFHSSHMTEHEVDYQSALGDIRCSQSTIQFYSSLKGRKIRDMDAKYWVRNMVEPVRYSAALTSMLSEVDVLVEVGPHPVLMGPSKQCMTDKRLPYIATLKRESDAFCDMLSCVGQLFVRGCSVDLAAVNGNQKHTRLNLPPYPWDHKHYWSSTRLLDAYYQRPARHPLLGALTPGSTPFNMRWRTFLRISELPWLKQHVLDGKIIFPGAGYITMAIEALYRNASKSGSVRLQDVKMKAPLMIDESDVGVEVYLELRGNRFQVASFYGGKWSENCIGSIAFCNSSYKNRASIDPVSLKKRVSARTMYRAIERAGLYLGPRFSLIQGQILCGEEAVLAKVSYDENVYNEHEASALQPGLLDVCFQSAFLGIQAATGGAGAIFVPNFIKSLQFSPGSAANFRVQNTLRMGNARTAICQINLGSMVTIEGLEMTALSGQKKTPIFDIKWRPSFSLNPQGSLEALLKLYKHEFPHGRIRFVGEDASLPLEPVEDVLGSKTAHINIAVATDNITGWEQLHPDDGFLLASYEMAGHPDWDCILNGATWVYQKCVERPATEVCNIQIGSDIDILQPGCTVVIDLRKSATAFTAEHWPWLRKLLTSRELTCFWLCSGATMDCSQPEYAKLVGMIRVARNEYRGKHMIVDVDVDDIGPVQTFIHTAEEDLTLRQGIWYIPRLVPASASQSHETPVVLEIETIGLLETLRFMPQPIHELKPNEVEIEVEASALNFRDMAAAMGLIIDSNLGDECAGVVCRVGSQVTTFKPGDRVVACRPGQGAHSTYVHQPESMCEKVPDDMSLQTAASFSGVLTTAYHALVNIARLRSGDSVLIHAAAGGVGQMAVQLAKSLGAVVFATCSEPKRHFVESMGIPATHVFSSRDDSFVEGVMKMTNNKGVDVVLNSLAGDLLFAGLKVVAPLGRFIELGKADIHHNSELGMELFRGNKSFSSVDLVKIYEDHPDVAKQIFSASCNLFFSGKIKPLPIVEFPYQRAEEAFRTMQLGKQIGKIVLSGKLGGPPATNTYREGLYFNARKSYLIVGGGGLATVLMEWMARCGANSFVVLSRSETDFSWFSERNITVQHFKGDVRQKTDVKTCIQSMHELGGIFHTAAALIDAPLSQVSIEHLQQVMGAKCDGAWNLHEATKEIDLDCFVCFSSTSATIGNIGQSSYAAANAYLDALMVYRQQQGLPGVSISIGAVDGAGMLERDPSVHGALVKMGHETIDEMDMLHQLQLAVTENRSSVTGVSLQKNVFWANRSLFKGLYNNQGDSVVQDKPEDLLEGLLEKASRVFGVDRQRIQAEANLARYGLDSIVAVELQRWLMDRTGKSISILDVTSSESLKSLAEKIN